MPGDFCVRYRSRICRNCGRQAAHVNTFNLTLRNLIIKVCVVETIKDDLYNIHLLNMTNGGKVVLHVWCPTTKYLRVWAESLSGGQLETHKL